MIKVREGYKNSEVGVIPVEWEVVELDDIVEFKNGKGHEKVIDESGQYIVVNSKFIASSGNVYKSSNSNLSPLKQNDIVLVMSDIPNGKALAKCFYIEKDNRYTLNQRICSLKAIQDNPLFLFYRLNRNRYFLKFNDGVNQTNLRKNEVLECKIPLPPLKEQEKIADILSTADEKIDAIELQIQKAHTLKKGLLQKLLSEGIGHSEFKDSELGKIPESWEVVELPPITDKITSGGTPSRKKAEYFKNGTVNWIKTGELRDCYIYNSKEKITEEAVANSSAKVFPVDTLLIAMYGATIGRTAYLKTECSTNQACCAIIFNQSIANPYFYWKYFHFIKDDLISQGRGAGQPNISQAIIKTLLIPLPPLKEQKQIASILTTADEKLEVLRAKKEKYETLKKGLLQKLLSGEIRV